jgi:lauroyl/myristoyl acyltransferase
MLSHLLSGFRFTPSLSKFCQARGNVFLFRLLPFRLSRWYLGLLGALYFWLNRKEKNLIRRVARYVLGGSRPPGSLGATTRRIFRGILDHYHEKLFTAYSNFPRLLRFLDKRISLTGEAALREALAQGRGVILVTGHFGAVEFLPGCLAVKGFPVSMICRFQTDRLRESLLRRARAVHLDIIDASGGNVFLAAVKALKAGRILITEMDEFDEWRLDDQSGVTFLNSRLPADKTLEILRKRSGSPVVVGLVHRLGGRRYALKLEAVTRPGQPEPLPVAPRCLAVLEKAVLAEPALWYQWKKFGTMIAPELEAAHDHREAGYLAPEIAVSLPLQA